MNENKIDTLEKKKISHYIFGMIAAFGVYCFAAGVAHFFPTLGIASFAIILGIILGNTIFSQFSAKLEHGTKFCESRLLEYSIVLLGARVSFSTIGSLGVSGVLYIIILMVGTIAFTYYLARKFGFSKEFSLLLGAGNAVCGSSAIGASSKVLKSGISETGLAITMVNVLGTILMFFLPLIVIPIFFNNMLFESSALLGGTLQSVGQVVAGAAIIGDRTVKFALIFKIFRIIMLTFVLMLFSYIKEKDDEKIDVECKGVLVENKAIKISIPWYIVGFFILSTLATLGILPDFFVAIAHRVSGFFEVIALAAIGLRVSFSVIKKEGPKSLVLSLIIGTFQIVFAIALIKLIL